MHKFDKAQFVVEGTYDEQTQSCLICLQPITYPVQCQKCTSLFCKNCADKWKKSNHKCPKKCSINQWVFITSKSLSILLRCPYQNKKCKNMSLQEFEIHHKVCDKSKQLEIKTKEELKKQYLCKKGHKLSYIGTENRNYIHSICTQCRQYRVSRSICLQCKQNQELRVAYCCLCRTPPLNRSVCPQGHQFKINNEIYLIKCDYCSKRVNFAGQFCYNDSFCDYDLCLTCFEQLPKQNVIYESEGNNNKGIQPLLRRSRRYD